MNAIKLLNNLIESGKFVKVDFIKKDGSVGTVHGRTGVKKYTSGGIRTSKDSEYIMFWDKNKGYRNVNRKTIIAVNGQSLHITKGALC